VFERASSNVWRKNAFDELETIVSLAPDMGVTSLHSDYVLPIAHHYERNDLMLQSRVPYLQVLNEAVAPLGESVDDWETNRRLAEANFVFDRLHMGLTEKILSRRGGYC
jgi:nitrate reductase alpha subunit